MAQRSWYTLELTNNSLDKVQHCCNPILLSDIRAHCGLQLWRATISWCSKHSGEWMCGALWAHKTKQVSCSPYCVRVKPSCTHTPVLAQSCTHLTEQPKVTEANRLEFSIRETTALRAVSKMAACFSGLVTGSSSWILSLSRDSERTPLCALCRWGCSCNTLTNGGTMQDSFFVFVLPWVHSAYHNDKTFQSLSYCMLVTYRRKGCYGGTNSTTGKATGAKKTWNYQRQNNVSSNSSGYLKYGQ